MIFIKKLDKSKWFRNTAQRRRLVDDSSENKLEKFEKDSRKKPKVIRKKPKVIRKKPKVIRKKILYFIRIPKTGSSYFVMKYGKYIVNYQEIFDSHHSFYRPFKMIISNKNHKCIDLRKKYKTRDMLEFFTIIRNPFDLFVSYHLHERENDNISGWCDVNNIHNLRSFSDFCDFYIDRSKVWHIDLFKKSLFCQMFNKNEHLMINNKNIMRHENLYSDIERFFKSRSINVQLYKGYVNKTVDKEKEYRGYYKGYQIDALNKIWKRDLEKFNYKF